MKLDVHKYLYKKKSFIVPLKGLRGGGGGHSLGEMSPKNIFFYDALPNESRHFSHFLKLLYFAKFRECKKTFLECQINFIRTKN